jgi:hypothetical protein
VSGEIAGSFCPLDRGLTIGFAVGTYFISDHTVASFARLNDGITSPTIVGTAGLLHEDALCTHFDGLTNHDDLPPFLLNLFFQTIRNDLNLWFQKRAQKKRATTFW